MRHFCRAGVLLCGLAAGCATRGDTEALEAALRGHENQIASLERELAESREELTVARREVEHIRSQAAKSGDVVLASEQSEVLFRAEGLRINTLLTGGLDEDGRPGDDVLSVVLEPFDADEQTLKLPGDVTIELSDPAAAGDAESIGTWTYTAQDVRKAWHAGLLVTGFKFRLPLSVPPQHETLVLHARLATTDGRVFDATETVKVNLAPRE
ncbi:MAG: hypothetical protein WBC44_18355 [Planctomycetaceae bacterium]